MMRPINSSPRRRWAVLCLCVASISATAQDVGLTQLVTTLAPTDTSVAFVLSELGQQEPLVSYHGQLKLLPASLQKLLTASAAIKVLGGDFRFTTSLLTDGRIEDQLLSGNLYLVFKGDPALTSIQLRTLLAKLKELGIRRIQGDLMLVGNTRRATKAPGWVWDDLGICYAAPVSSFIVDGNCVKAVMRPTGKPLPKDTMGIIPATVTLRSKAPFTVDSDAGYGNGAFCQLALVNKGPNHIDFTGCFPEKRPLNLAFAINDPAAFTGDWSREILDGLNIRLTGQVRLASLAPVDAHCLGEISSVPVYDLTAKLLLESDNLISDTLLLAMAEKHWGKDAGFNQGVTVLSQALEEMGIELSNHRLEDGSGLSRYNLLSAGVLNQLLVQIHADPQLRPLINALPKAGESGTLAHKAPYTQGTLKHRIIAKTGSMGGVDNLAGYFSVAGKDYSFVVLENGLTIEDNAPQKAWHGKILAAVIQQLESRALRDNTR
ncbi:D-alanyl-D-alanine carboxypeptidase/D-alanyl-D-alanine endopeptidase [Shewanella sp. GXUN23E]|uniref:D-alanyl-D-alanine carboxypeptidase/D-alanyl-D-alanine endopeptidase n=1 Tax=Shewanella sp. GXUN23E TaxID=3422498 RepID=UPI003D7DEC3F